MTPDPSDVHPRAGLRWLFSQYGSAALLCLLVTFICWINFYFFFFFFFFLCVVIFHHILNNVPWRVTSRTAWRQPRRWVTWSTRVTWPSSRTLSCRWSKWRSLNEFTSTINSSSSNNSVIERQASASITGHVTCQPPSRGQLWTHFTLWSSLPASTYHDTGPLVAFVDRFYKRTRQPALIFPTS